MENNTNESNLIYLSGQEQRNLINRLSRIEGQLRGVKKMLEKNAYCTDVLIQISAAKAALDSFNRELMGSHIRNIVVKDILNGGEEKSEELIDIIHRLVK